MVELLYASYAQLKLIHDIETNPGPSSYRVPLKTTSIEPRPSDDNSFYILRSKTASTDWVLDTDYRKATNINFDNAYVNLTPAQIAANSGKVLYNNGDTLEWLSFSDVNIAELSSHATYASFPSSNQSTSKIYLDQSNGEFYRWSGSAYVRTDANGARKNEANTFTALNTFSSGLTVSSGTTTTGALSASSVTTGGTVTAVNASISGTATIKNITASSGGTINLAPATSLAIGDCTANEIQLAVGGTNDLSLHFGGTYGICGQNSAISFCHSNYLICDIYEDGIWFNSSGNGFNRGIAIETMGSGSDQFIGSATLVNGTVTINNTRVQSNAHIFLTYKTLAGGGPYQSLYVHGIDPGNSFTVRPTDGAVSYNDSSFYFWIIPQTF